jgi:uncharacterized membrane protein
MGLQFLDIEVPIARPILGFVYLTFLPGLTFLKILNVKGIDKIRFILYSAGVSISFIMFSGVLINFFLFNLGVKRPLSLIPLMISLSLFVMALCILAYHRDKESHFSDVLDLRKYISQLNQILFLLLLPLVTILGVFIANTERLILPLMVLLSIIALIPLTIAFDKFFTKNLYFLVIYAIAISILLHVTLISPYPYAWNIDVELFFSQLVAKDAYWNSSSSLSGINSLLSIVMLAPIYSNIMGIDMIWVYKAVYPFIHALIPVAIFEVSRENIGRKKAFLSTFFYISVSGFFITMSLFRREQVSELFLILIILLMVDAALTRVQRSTLFILFVTSLTVSHYGVSYISQALFLFSLVSLYAFPKVKMLLGIENDPSNKLQIRQIGVDRLSLFNLRIQLIWLTFMLFWFIFIAGSFNFHVVIGKIRSSFNSLYELFSYGSVQSDAFSQAFAVDLPSASLLGWLFRALHYSTELLIIVGFVAVLLKLKIFKLNRQYRYVILSSVLFLLFSTFVPVVAQNWDVMRLYNFTLLVISPLIIIGSETLWRCIFQARQKFRSNSSQSKICNKRTFYIIVVIMILIPYFLFNTGYINIVARDHIDILGVPRSIPLTRWISDSAYYSEEEISGAEWLSQASPNSTTVMGDYLSIDLLSYWFPKWSLRNILAFSATEKIPRIDYIYLRGWNINEGEIRTGSKSTYLSVDQMLESSGVGDNAYKLYDNGGCLVLCPHWINGWT